MLTAQSMSSSGEWSGVEKTSTGSVCCLPPAAFRLLPSACCLRCTNPHSHIVRELDEEESAYRVKADYLSPDREAELRESRGDDRSYVTESRSVRLPAFNSTAAIAVSSGRKVVVPAAQSLERRELAKEFNSELKGIEPLPHAL